MSGDKTGTWSEFLKKTASQFTANVIKTALSEHYRDERRRVMVSAAARTLLQKFGVSEKELEAIDKDVASFGKKHDTDSSTKNTEKDIDKKKDGGTVCVVCMEHDREVLFLPCKHLCTCSECAARLIICCICRQRIEERVNVFL